MLDLIVEDLLISSSMIANADILELTGILNVRLEERKPIIANNT